MGLKVVQNNDGSVRMYQPPGDRNALGRIRFNFPNKFLVYQHDTPDKHLFAHDKRALQPRLHAGAGPAEIRRGAAVDRASEGQLYRRQAAQACLAPEEREITFPTADPGAHHLPDRLCR